MNKKFVNKRQSTSNVSLTVPRTYTFHSGINQLKNKNAYHWKFQQSVVCLQSSIVSKFVIYEEKSMAMRRSRHCLFSWTQIYEA